MAHFRLGLAYIQKGMHEMALEELRTSEALSGDRDVVAAIGHLHAVMGKRDEAERALNELEEKKRQTYVSSYDLALIYVGLNELDQAFAWLEKAYEERSYWLIYLKVDPMLDNLRSDPRFARLMAWVGLAA